MSARGLRSSVRSGRIAARTSPIKALPVPVFAWLLETAWASRRHLVWPSPGSDRSGTSRVMRVSSVPLYRSPMIFETPSTVPDGNALMRLVIWELPDDQEGGDRRRALCASNSCRHRHEVSDGVAKIVLVRVEIVRGIANIYLAGGAFIATHRERA